MVRRCHFQFLPNCVRSIQSRIEALQSVYSPQLREVQGLRLRRDATPPRDTWWQTVQLSSCRLLFSELIWKSSFTGMFCICFRAPGGLRAMG